MQQYGRVDILVNNAGVPAPMIPVADTDIEAFDLLMAINVRGVLLGMKHVAPVMAAQNAGSIINIASVAGLRGGVSGHIYSTTKGAVLALTRSVAAELGEKGVRVNSISPGAHSHRHFRQGRGRRRRQGRPGDRRHQAGLRDHADHPPRRLARGHREGRGVPGGRRVSFINGQDLVVDGGMTSAGRNWSATAAARAAMGAQLKKMAESE